MSALRLRTTSSDKLQFSEAAWGSGQKMKVRFTNDLPSSKNDFLKKKSPFAVHNGLGGGVMSGKLDLQKLNFHDHGHQYGS